MAARSDGEPFVETINFGSHYCAMYRWDDTEGWTILSDGKKCRRIFPSATIAILETRRILKARRPILATKAEADQDVLGVTAWREQKAGAAEAERRAVFGSDGPKTIFIPGGRQVEVVMKRRRA